MIMMMMTTIIPPGRADMIMPTDGLTQYHTAALSRLTAALHSEMYTSLLAALLLHSPLHILYCLARV